MWQQLDWKLPVWRTRSAWSKCWDAPLPWAWRSSESGSGICAHTPWRGAWRSSWQRHGSWEGKELLFSVSIANKTYMVIDQTKIKNKKSQTQVHFSVCNVLQSTTNEERNYQAVVGIWLHHPPEFLSSPSGSPRTWVQTPWWAPSPSLHLPTCTRTCGDFISFHQTV